MHQQTHYTWRPRVQLGRNGRLLVVICTLLPLLVFSFIEPPIRQNEAYHHFADTRTVAHIPNFYNVVSNLTFLIVGIAGLHFLWQDNRATTHTFRHPAERRPYLVLFLGVAATCFGSIYYHLHPNDVHLVWDRLPITFGFMAYFAIIIMERIDRRAGIRLLLPLTILGVWSVWYWYHGDLRGAGDLRFYVDVQFYPMIAIPLIALLFPASYTHGRNVYAVLALYALAKLFEWQDAALYHALEGLVSGHTLKHLTAALATATIILTLKRRRRLVTSRREYDSKKKTRV